MEAINIGGQYTLEAGTGTGKTLGYLIPVCEHIRINKDRQVLVATATINLMDQIVKKEWETVTQNTLYRGQKVEILMGRRNYLCISALKRLFRLLYQEERQKDGISLLAADRLAWLNLYQILDRRRGRWDRFDEFERQFQYDLNAEKVCKPKLCTTDSNCCFPQALRRTQYAHVVITNHHKLSKLDAEIASRVSVCIIDEADQFPDNLRSSLTVSLVGADISDFTRRVGGANEQNGFVDVFWNSLKKKDKANFKECKPMDVLSASDLDSIATFFGRKPRDGQIQDLFHSLKNIKNACGEIYSCVKRMTVFPNKDLSELRWKKLDPKKQATIQDSLKGLIDHFNTIESEFEEILKMIQNTIQVKRNKIKSEYTSRMNKYVNDAREFGAVVNNFRDTDNDDGYIISYGQKSFNWTMNRFPFEMGNHAKAILDNFDTAVFTSATLYVDNSTELFALELLDDPDPKHSFTAETSIPSPFSYDSKVSGAIAHFIPKYEYGHEKSNLDWIRQVASTLSLQSLALDGRTLVLFTSWYDLLEAYKLCHPVFQHYRIPLLLQDKFGSSEAIIREFSGFEESVLFGVRRFWTGVDFPGSTLSQLVIVRLPNKPLKDPLVAERKDRWSKKIFDDLWYLQNTQRTLRQGFGRLIRKSGDWGVFVVLDCRILTDDRFSHHKNAFPVKLEEFGSAVELANWSVKRLGFSPEIKERGIVLEQAHQNIQKMIFAVK